MRLSAIKKKAYLVVSLMVLLTMVVTACAGGVPQKDVDALKAELTVAQADAKAKDAQIADANKAKAKAEAENAAKSQASTIVQSPGQLIAPVVGAPPTGWNTPASVQAKLSLYAEFADHDTGPDAWDAKAHPVVFISSMGPGPRRVDPARPKAGYFLIDAKTKEVIGSWTFKLADTDDITFGPHNAGASPNGKYAVIGFADKVKGTGETRNLTLLINLRTAKIAKVLRHPAQRFHHSSTFTDSKGNQRWYLTYGFGSAGSPSVLLDTNTLQVVKTIDNEFLGQHMGHPYPTVSPDGKFLWASIEATYIKEETDRTAAMAKINLENDAIVLVPGVGNHPIGQKHTADGAFTYVNDGDGSRVYKIDNKTNRVVDSTSAGVAGPYGNVLNWDESELYLVGKGEGSHNKGGGWGLIDTKIFRQTRGFESQPFLMTTDPITGLQTGSASSLDHSILNPDPTTNELWGSNMNGWEIIIFSLDTHKVTKFITVPNGGDTHSGGFIRYTDGDFNKGLVLNDMGNPSKEMYTEIAKRVAARK